MKKVLLSALAGALAVFWSSPALSAVEIKLGHVCPATGDRLEESAQIFKKYVEEKSNGEIKVTTFPASQLGGEREMLEAIQMGTLESGTITNAPFSNFLSEILVFDIPFTFDSAEQAHRVLDGPFGDKIRELLLKKTGIRCLVYGENGLRHFTFSKKPVRTPADMAGLKIRVMENPAHMEMIRKLGGIPTAMAFAELYTALAQGVVDGQENPVSLIESMRFYEVQKYMTLDGHLYAPYLFVFNNDFYEGLSDEHKKILQEGAELWRKEERARNAAQSERGVEFMRSKGMEPLALTDAEHEQFKKAAFGVQAAIRKQIGDGIVDEFLKAVRDAQ